MLFNSLAYVLFLPAVFALHYALPARRRWLLLLVASYGFYAAWKPLYLLLIVASTVVDYLCGLAMGARSERGARRPFLVISLLINLGLLAAFKYYGFLSDALVSLLGWGGFSASLPAFEVLLPVGISFYTFQTLSYSIDVYRGVRPPERHLGFFALYVSFFPQLVAGPIERSTRLLPQLRAPRAFQAEAATEGLRRILWGFFKKLVIADRLSALVDPIYADPGAQPGWVLAVATYAFAFQIYCDFSGYTDIAIGSARLLGVDLMENFRAPYFARSIREFWQRWHISLSTWFRDYLYLPLGGNRVARFRWFANLLIVFVVSGLWHGANWTFVLWGALHGAYLVFAIVTQPGRDRLWQALGSRPGHPVARLRAVWQMVWTFHLVCVAWVLFRVASLSQAGTLFEQIVRQPFAEGNLSTATGLTTYQLILAASSVALLLVVDLFENRPFTTGTKQDIRSFLGAPLRRWQRWTLYYSVGLAVLLFGRFGLEEFIYFQF